MEATGGDVGIAIGVVLLLIAAVAAVQMSRDAGTLNAFQLVGIMVIAGLLVVLVLKALTSARSRRGR